MINLAPIKYANCFESDGGPVHSIEESKIDFNGERYSVSNARLADEYRSSKRIGVIFSPVDGTGVDRNPLFARYKSISESIERWAFYDIINTNGREYGLMDDPTSNGIAAFPGLFARQARKYAMREAIERYSLVAWWAGLLGINPINVPQSGVSGFMIDQPFKDHYVVVTRVEASRGFSAFGYGCGSNKSSAIENAISEMERSRIMLSAFYKKNPGFECGDLLTIADYSERRLVYYSMHEGIDEFEKRISQTNSISCPAKPKLIFDGQIKGRWSRYASVWRVLYEMPNKDYLNPNKLTFYW